MFVSMKKANFRVYALNVFLSMEKCQSRVYLRSIEQCEPRVIFSIDTKCNFRVYALNGSSIDRKMFVSCVCFE